MTDFCYQLRSESIDFLSIDAEVTILQLETKFYFSLNPAATQLWACIVAGASRRQMVESFGHIEPHQLEILDAFLKRLVEERLVLRKEMDAPPTMTELLTGDASFQAPKLNKFGHIFIRKKRKWPVFLREEWPIFKRRFRDDRWEWRFRIARLFRLQSQPVGGLITKFSPSVMHGFYPVEHESGSFFRWSEAEASIDLATSAAPHSLWMKLRPFRDLERLFEDGLVVSVNGHAIPKTYFEWKEGFLVSRVDADWLKPEGRQDISWSIRPWPATEDPRNLGLPLSRIWVCRE